MRGRRARPLTAGEAKLWVAVARHVAPLPGKALPPEPAEPAPDLPPPSTEAPAPRLPGARPTPTPALKPLAPIEPKLKRALARGRVRPEAVLDLHGLHQAEAHRVLNGFLLRAQADGCRLVTVVTGKGRPTDGAGERGILRRMVPHWLAQPGLRAVVLGWDEAAPHRGGGGALLVRLRSRNPGRLEAGASAS